MVTAACYPSTVTARFGVAGNPSLTLGALIGATTVREWFSSKAQDHPVEDLVQ